MTYSNFERTSLTVNNYIMIKLYQCYLIVIAHVLICDAIGNATINTSTFYDVTFLSFRKVISHRLLT